MIISRRKSSLRADRRQEILDRSNPSMAWCGTRIRLVRHVSGYSPAINASGHLRERAKHDAVNALNAL